MAQGVVCERQTARWGREPLTPEGREDVVRRMGQVERCRQLTQGVIDILERPRRVTRRGSR
jgi:hypothetical protein